MKKIALITGASSGIGRELCLLLAKEGYYILMASRNIKKLRDISNNLNNSFKDVVSDSFELDVRKKESINELYNKVLSIGIPDIIINNAGIGTFANIEDITDEEWDNHISTNLTGPFLISRSFISDFKKRKKGTLVFINSVAGKYGYPYSQAYVSSKFGLRGFADSLRNELRDFNIKVVSVFPGAISTSFWDKVKTDFSKKEMLSCKDSANIIVRNILAKDNIVVEEIVIRRTRGDF